MELNGLANIDMILQLTNNTDIKPELKAKIQEQIDLSIVYFKAFQKNNDVKWHEVIADFREHK